MKYNFESYLNRRKTGSSKWLNMDMRCDYRGSDIIPMSVADMDFLLCPEIEEGLREYIASESLGYSKPVDDYLQAVVKFFRDYHGYYGEKEWIVTTPGIVSALATSVRISTEPGDGVLVFTPIYKPFFDVVEGQGRKVVECPLIYEGNKYYIDFQLLASLIKEENIKLIMLCNPHNPAGRIWTEEELGKVADLVIENDIRIVSDEIHSDIFYGSSHNVLAQVNKDIGKRAIICTAASKSFNIAGLQCSNIFIENEDIRNEFILSNEAIGIERANVLGMLATEAAYERGLDWLEELKEVIARNNDYLYKFFEKYEGIFRPMEADASFLVWINFEESHIDHEEFLNFLDLQCKFFVSDGLSFGERGRNWIRINTGLPFKKLEENLARFEKTLKECYNI